MLFVQATKPITARRASVIARLADQRPAMTRAVAPRAHFLAIPAKVFVIPAKVFVIPAKVFVIPAKAGIQGVRFMDPRLRAPARG